MLTRLHSMGEKLSIDDFGTGYSSLAYLQRLPVDELKIDRSFVTSLADVSDDAIIVRSTIDLAHNLGLKVVAEGVEDEAVMRILTEYGCDAAQGYFFSRPFPLRRSPSGWRYRWAWVDNRVLVARRAWEPSARVCRRQNARGWTGVLSISSDSVINFFPSVRAALGHR